MKALTLLLAGTLAVGCADAGKTDGSAYFNNTTTNSGPSNNDGFVPEVEDEFEFAEPAVVGANVFVANETLNSIAIIDSRSLAIRTAPVGFRPTRVVGPTEPGPDSQVFVLNQGSNTVSIIKPETLEVHNANVLRHANSLAATPDGTWAIAWFDDRLIAEGETAGDLSGATVVKADGSTFELAVGFRIERVAFVSGSEIAMLLSDDGVSTVRFADLTGDAVVPPVAVLPPELQQFDRTDREVVLDPAGEWAIARVATSNSVVLTELSTGIQWRAPLPARPTDLDWVVGSTPRLLGMLPDLDAAFITTVPDGLIALADSVVPAADMGAGDMGAGDMGAGDMGAGDLGANDVGTNDMAADTGSDASMAVDLPTMPVEGFSFLTLSQPGLGAAEVASSGANALLFSTIGNERRAILLDLSDLEQRGLSFEKGVRGAISDRDDTTFIVLHSREEGAIPPGTSPSDPVFIDRSWGISIVDLASAATRLVLTEQQPGPATLWQGETTSRLFMTFVDDGSKTEALRDVLRIDLRSFSTSTFRVPSLPEGLGRIDDANRVFVNQKHPQGRMTFVDVTTDRRQTVTGYQLNSGID